MQNIITLGSISIDLSDGTVTITTNKTSQTLSPQTTEADINENLFKQWTESDPFWTTVQENQSLPLTSTEYRTFGEIDNFNILLSINGSLRRITISPLQDFAMHLLNRPNNPYHEWGYIGVGHNSLIINYA